MAKKNSGQGMFDALTLRQAERLLDVLRSGAEALPHDLAGDMTASEIYEVMNNDLHPAHRRKALKALRARS